MTVTDFVVRHLINCRTSHGHCVDQVGGAEGRRGAVGFHERRRAGFIRLGQEVPDAKAFGGLPVF